MATFAWARVLERYFAGDLAAASAALEKARQENRFIELYLTVRKKMPRALPDMYSPGSDEEAIVCLDNIGPAWAEPAWAEPP